jgi:hypothetical protein
VTFSRPFVARGLGDQCEFPSRTWIYLPNLTTIWLELETLEEKMVILRIWPWPLTPWSWSASSFFTLWSRLGLQNIPTKFEDNSFGTANARGENYKFWAFDLDFDLDDLDQGHLPSGVQMAISTLVYLPSFVNFRLELLKYSLGRTHARTHAHTDRAEHYPPRPLRGSG